MESLEHAIEPPRDNHHELPLRRSLLDEDDDSTTTTTTTTTTSSSGSNSTDTSNNDQTSQPPIDDDRAKDSSFPTQDEIEASTAANISNPPQPPFSLSDHVYQWCGVAGLPVFQHHGIVMGVHWDETDQEWLLHISDFSNLDYYSSSERGSGNNGTASSSLSSPARTSNPFSSSSSSTSKEGRGGWRSYASPASKWRKVLYDAKWWQNATSRSGTCTSGTCDPPGVVRARVQFLQQNSETILDMPYHWLKANCECVAVWCKTGTWATVQGHSLLAHTAASQVKSTAVLASTVASTQVAVTAPAAGLWGWMGFTTTTQVSLLAAQPWLLPALATYGVVSVGIPAAILHGARKEWKATTQRLNDEFWARAAIDQQQVFVESILHWRRE